MLLRNTGKEFPFIDTLRLKVYIVFKIKYINENVVKRHSISNQKLRVRKGNTTFKYIFGLLTVLNAYSLEASHGTTNTAFNHNRR